MGAVTKIKFAAGIEADVSLVKTSTEPKAAKWETRKVDAEGNPLAVLQPIPTAVDLAEGDDPFGGGPQDMPEPVLDAVGSAPVSAPQGVRPIIPQTPDQARQRDAMAARAVPPAVKTQRGVTRKTEGKPDEFVDLTGQLAEIDERVKIGGMEVIAAISSPSVPRNRIRDAHYLVPKDDAGRKVLALIWHALADGTGKSRALVVRWSKRTNQAIGVIVPRAGKWLELLEVEFSSAMRAVPPAAIIDVEMSEQAIANATRFVDSLGGHKSDLDAIDDERRTLHAQLLESARNGKTWEMPARDDVDDEIAKILAEAAESLEVTA